MRLSAYASKEVYLTWKSESLELLLDALAYQNSVLPDLKKKKLRLESGSHFGFKITMGSRLPWTQGDHVSQASLELVDTPASASQMLGLQVWAWIVCFEWRLVEDIFFFLLVKKELSALTLWLSFVQKKNKNKLKTETYTEESSLDILMVLCWNEMVEFGVVGQDSNIKVLIYTSCLYTEAF